MAYTIESVIKFPFMFNMSTKKNDLVDDGNV